MCSKLVSAVVKVRAFLANVYVTRDSLCSVKMTVAAETAAAGQAVGAEQPASGGSSSSSSMFASREASDRQVTSNIE